MIQSHLLNPVQLRGIVLLPFVIAMQITMLPIPTTIYRPSCYTRYLAKSDQNMYVTISLKEVFATSTSSCWDSAPMIGYSAENLKFGFEVLA